MLGRWRPQLVLLAVSALLLLVNLGATSLWDIDEPRNAGCAAEMYSRGEWIVPTFNGQLRSHKPVLLYWLMMSAYAMFGVNEFAARFWSAVLSIGTVLSTYQLGCRLFNRTTGLWAGIILASSLNFVVIGRAATPDAAFLFFTTMALSLFAYAALPAPSDGIQTEPVLPSWKQMAAVYLMLSLAVLTKGPVGVILPMAILVLWMLTRPASEQATDRDASALTFLRRARQVFRPEQIAAALWSLRALTGLAVLAVVALPWYVAVGVRTEGQWLAEFFGQHNIGRFLTPMENHRGPIYYYVLAVAIGFLPWSLMIGLTIWQQVQRIRHRHPHHEAYRFLACWMGVFFVFFSLATTKLPHYMIPIYPALALMTAVLVESLINEESLALKRMLPLSAGLLMLVGLGLIVGLPLAARRFFPGDELLGLVGVLPLLGGAICLVLLHRSRVAAAMHSFAVCGIVLMAVLFVVLQQRIDRHQHSLELVAAIRQASAEDAQVAAFRYMRPSWVFYYGRPIADLAKPDEVAEFFAQNRNAFLILQESDLATVQSFLPSEIKKLVSWPKFLKSGNVVVLTRTESVGQAQLPYDESMAGKPAGTQRR